MTPTSLPFIGVVMCGFMDQRQFVTTPTSLPLSAPGDAPLSCPAQGKRKRRFRPPPSATDFSSAAEEM